jgi:hypothetical protein
MQKQTHRDRATMRHQEQFKFQIEQCTIIIIIIIIIILTKLIKIMIIMLV